MKYLRALYLKELKAEKAVILTIVVILTALPLFLLTGIGKWDLGTAARISQFPLALIIYGLPFYSYTVIANEWNNKTSPMLTSLPVKGEYLLGAKLLVVWTQFLLFTMLLVAGFTLISTLEFATQPENLTFTLQTSIRMAALIYFSLLPLTPMIFLVYLSGISFSRWPAAARTVTAVFIYLIVFLGTNYLNLFINWGSVPIPMPMFSSGSSRATTISATYPIAIPLIYYVFSYITGLASFFYSARLLETRPHP